jgi:hypothetical protein
MRLLGNPLDIDKDKALCFWKTHEMLIHGHYSFYVLRVPNNVTEVPNSICAMVISNVLLNPPPKLVICALCSWKPTYKKRDMGWITYKCSHQAISKIFYIVQINIRIWSL